MTRLTFDIPDNNLNLFRELAEKLGIKIVQEDFEVPEWQKEQVRKAKKELDDGTAHLIEWNDLKEDLFKKYGVK